MILPVTFILVLVSSSAIISSNAEPAAAVAAPTVAAPAPVANPVPEPKPHQRSDSSQETLKVSETGYGNRVAYNPPPLPPPPPPAQQQGQQVHIQQEEDYPLQQNSYGPQSPAYSTKGGANPAPVQQQSYGQNTQQQQVDSYDSQTSSGQEYGQNGDQYNSQPQQQSYASPAAPSTGNSYSSSGSSYGATKGGSAGGYNNPSVSNSPYAPVSNYGRGQSSSYSGAPVASPVADSYGGQNVEQNSYSAYPSARPSNGPSNVQSPADYSSGQVSQSDYVTETGQIDSSYGSDDASFGGNDGGSVDISDSGDSYGNVDVPEGPSSYPSPAPVGQSNYPSNGGGNSYSQAANSYNGPSGGQSSANGGYSSRPAIQYGGAKGGASQYQSPSPPPQVHSSSYLPQSNAPGYGQPPQQQQQHQQQPQPQVQQQQQQSYNGNADYDAPGPISQGNSYGTKGNSGVKGGYIPRPPVRPQLPAVTQHPVVQQQQQQPPQQQQQQSYQPQQQQQQHQQQVPYPSQAPQYEVKGGGYVQNGPSQSQYAMPLSYGGFKPLPQYQTAKAIITKPLVLEIVQKTPSDIRYPVNGPGASYTSGPSVQQAQVSSSYPAPSPPPAYKPLPPSHAPNHPPPPQAHVQQQQQQHGPSHQQYEEQGDIDEYEGPEQNYAPYSNSGPGYPQRPRKPTSESYTNAGYALDYGRGKPYGGKWLQKPYGKKYGKKSKPHAAPASLYGVDDDELEINLPLQYGPPPQSSSAESLASYGISAQSLASLSLPSISPPSFAGLSLSGYGTPSFGHLRSPFKSHGVSSSLFSSSLGAGYPGASSLSASILPAATPLPSVASYSDDLTDGSYSVDKPAKSVAPVGSASSPVSSASASAPTINSAATVAPPSAASAVVSSYPASSLDDDSTAPAFSYKSAASKLIPNIVKAPFKTIFKAFTRNKLIG